MFGWKFRRELARLGSRLQAIPEALWEPVVQWNHDRNFAAGFPVYSGDVGLKDTIALLVIYQPTGLRASTIHKCEYLRAKGYAPFVVANAALSTKDRNALKAATWKTMVRRNFGHDFGAYRDGLLTLKSWNILPNRVLIMNDSVWFPIANAESLLDQLEASEADITGTILRTHRSGSFLESYCYMLSRKCLESPEFWRYWTGLRLTGNKYKVIRRGERGHSLALRNAGLSMCGLFSQDVFLSKIADFSDRELEQSLRYAAFVDPKLRQRNAFLLSAQRDQNWRVSVFDHIEYSLKKLQFYSAFPYASARIFKYPLLKASGDPVAQEWRLAFLTAIQDGVLEKPCEPVFAELCAKVSSDDRNSIIVERNLEKILQ